MVKLASSQAVLVPRFTMHCSTGMGILGMWSCGHLVGISVVSTGRLSHINDRDVSIICKSFSGFGFANVVGHVGDLSLGYERSHPSHRRWFQFGTGTMLLLVTIFALWLGWELSYIRERQATIVTLSSEERGFQFAMGADPSPRRELATRRLSTADDPMLATVARR